MSLILSSYFLQRLRPFTLYLGAVEARAVIRNCEHKLSSLSHGNLIVTIIGRTKLFQSPVTAIQAFPVDKSTASIVETEDRG